MTDPIRPPRDDLYRAMTGGVSSEDGKTLTIRLAPHDTWAEIESFTEGHFMERFARSAYRKTMRENAPKIMFQHGNDPEIGDKPIATTDDAGEDDASPYARGTILDGVPELVVDGLRKGVYGASHRFSVVREVWDHTPKGGPHNPDKLPERTISEAKLFELGPVTWPAYSQASASLRSLTDEMRGIPTPEPVAPPADAEPEVAHLVPERRDEPEPIAAPEHKESPAVDTIDEKRARFDELNEALERQAGAYPGVLPDDEQVTWNANVDERNKLGKDIEAWDARQALLIVARDKSQNTEPVVAWTPPVNRNQINRKAESELHSPESRATSFEGRVAEFRDDAKRITEKASFPHALADEARTRDKIDDLLDHHDSPDGELARRIKYTGSPVYLRAFEKIIKAKGSTIGLTPEEQRGTALAVGVDGTGGFTVPYAFDPTVIAIGAWSGAVNPYRRVCRVVPIIGTDTWNALTSTAVTATRTTEAAVTIEQGPTFAQPQYVVTRVQGQITASFEMFQDRTDLASEMAALIQEAKDNEEENSMAVGATAAANIGVGPVNGTSGAYTSLTTATSTTLAAADADAVEAALPVRHRFGAQWFLNRLSIRRFQTLETTGGKLFGGQQYQAVGVPELDRAGNTGLRLLGYPVNESPSLPTAQTANIVIGTLLAPQSYVIVERIGMSVQFIPFIFGASQGNLVTGQQALYFMYRNTAHPLNVDAGRTLRYLT